ncbi:sushi domain-containing protein 5 [Gambusia affinis]|uniref:sushi domain-containing protein 5 n=1 Tax=Gambusia affinis TaxID=33528 RepID=UPI001CDC238E|nr:sushi domain-containing protein 5 [Gambusia affinis]
MLYWSKQIVHSLFSGCMAFLAVTSVVNAGGRVFVLDPRSLQGFGEPEQACASQNARLASVEELRQAVVECFFSHCTRGWLYGGTVGTTVCNAEGSSLKAVNVKTENATEDSAHLSAFCMKDKAVICGDPPSFPNARLQDHSGFEMGDELLYTCTPGYVMPSGHSAFSLLCDSCGEWYGTVRICIKGGTETHVDYEDNLEDSYEETDHDRDSQEDIFRDTSQDGKGILQQHETKFWVNVEENHQDGHEVHGIGVKVINSSRTFGGTVDEVAMREEDAFTVHPRFEQDSTKLVRTGAAPATKEPVSLLSQKHMFWFPSEAFQEEVLPISSDSVTQATQRASGARSEESKENESQERLKSTDSVDQDDHDDQDDHHHDDDDHDDDDDKKDRNKDQDDKLYEDPGDDRDDNDDHDDNLRDDLDIHEGDRTDDHDDHNDHNDPDSRQEEDFDDNVKQPTHYDDSDRPDRNRDDDDHDDHYDMGEHEDGSDRTKEDDDHDDAYDDHPSQEDHDDDHRENDGEHPDDSEEQPTSDDHDDGEEHYDHDEDDIHDDRDDKDGESYDDHDSHEDDDHHPHLIISVANERWPNITQREAGSKSSKDNTWLDGYPVDLFDTENSDSTKGQMGTRMAKTTDKPNNVEVHKRVPDISLSDGDVSFTMAPISDQGREKKNWPGSRTPATSSDHSESSNSPSNSDTLDYDTQQVAPTHSWLDDLTNHPFLDHGPAPPVHDGNTFPGVIEEHTVDNLPGMMGEMEGEKRKTICVGEDCPPHPPSSTTQGAKVAAIIVAVCAVATAVIIGVWCYRRKQQKSSLYEMNGKGQSQSRQGQQIEMQQKV